MAGRRHLPEEFHTITPHLTVRQVAQAVQFYRDVFGAQELYRAVDIDGAVIHAELLLGDSRFFLNDEFPQYGITAPAPGRPALLLHLYVADADDTVARAVAAGATLALPLCDQPWGDRYAQIRDPFGHLWSVATRREDLAPHEVQRRIGAALAQLRAGKRD